MVSDGRVIDVEAGGIHTPVLTSGDPSDSAVVFVHGNPGRGADWQSLMNELPGPTYCVAPDMPGYGGADKPASFEYTTDGYARHLALVLDQLGIKHVHLVLHDLGGAWGLAWAAAHPDALASLTLINIGALPGYKWHWFARIYRLRGLGELVLATSTPAALKWAAQQGSGHALPRDFIEYSARSYRDPGTRRAVLNYYRATPDLGEVTETAAAGLKDVNPRTLVIWGAGDPYVPVRYAEIQRDYFPRAAIEVLRSSGHWPHLDDLQGVAAPLRSFTVAAQLSI